MKKSLWLLTEIVERTTRESETCEKPTVWAVFELIKYCPFLFFSEKYKYTAGLKSKEVIFYGIQNRH